MTTDDVTCSCWCCCRLLMQTTFARAHARRLTQIPGTTIEPLCQRLFNTPSTDRRNHSCSANYSVYSYTFLRSVVCLSVVCDMRAPHSTDLDAIWQVHTLCQKWSHKIKGRKEEIRDRPSNPQPRHKMQIADKPSVIYRHLHKCKRDRRFRPLTNYFGPC